MNIEAQVASLPFAKRLKELGVQQQSLFWHIAKKDSLSEYRCFGIGYTPDILRLLQDTENYEFYAAYTVAELMDILPAFIDTKENEPFNGFWFALNKRRSLNIQYIVNYRCDTTSFGEWPCDLIKHNIYDEMLPDCLAKMLIHLIENGLMVQDKNI